MVQYKTDDTHLLVSLSNTKGQNFILKLSVLPNVLKILLTDKATAERWKCAYESSYIENLTRKTGNFKQFTVFVSMLKAGLLRTNECVFVELLRQDELEIRRKRAANTTSISQRNRKYLILIYQVEFDKIHYPLPLEYCGKPDPEVLQSTIRKLENDVNQVRTEMARQMMKYKADVEARELTFRDLIAQLNNENKILYEENTKLKKQLAERQSNDWTSRMVQKLEAELKRERDTNAERIYRLEIENRKLTSIVTGRVSRSPVPIKLMADATFKRPTSVPRTSSSCCLLDRGDISYGKKRTNRKSPSPARKSSFSSSEKSERSSSLRRTKDCRTKGKGSSSSEGTVLQMRKDSCSKKHGRTRSRTERF